MCFSRFFSIEKRDLLRFWELFHTFFQHCSRLLDDYSPAVLSPCVLVQYPFFAGTVDACCRWTADGSQADMDELRGAARRLRAFMMALYARDSVYESFLTALNRRVRRIRVLLTQLP